MPGEQPISRFDFSFPYFFDCTDIRIVYLSRYAKTGWRWENSQEESGIEHCRFPEKEDLLKETQALAIKDGRSLATGQGHEEKKGFQGAHGGLAEDEPVAGGSHSRPETRYHAVEFAARGRAGGSAGGD